MEALLGNLGIEVLDTLPTQFHCNCSKERVEKAVASVGREDLQAMIDDGEDIEVKCDFCNSTYKYTVDELKEIRKRATKKSKLNKTCMRDCCKSNRQGERHETGICKGCSSDTGYPCR